MSSEMSYETLGNTLDECSTISSLNLTKNPFDNPLNGDLHLPALSDSPSIFQQTETPGSQKKKGFRWSIDQMSKLDPADIDEFPNQQYSSHCERPEDEEKVQEALDKYFHGTILPSPWTPDSNIKHVTFSPHPPSTNYISGDEDSIADMSHSSINGGTSAMKNHVDACCQTSLTFPPTFDLSKIVDSGFYSYIEEEGNSRDLNASSLRRKLFSPDDPRSPLRSHDNVRSRATRSILKSTSPKNYVTSSPVHHKNPKITVHSYSSLTASASSTTSKSPAVSPIKAQAAPSDVNDMSCLNLNETSHDDVFHSEILESSDVHIDPQQPPDVSPIRPSHVDSDSEVDNIDEDGGPMKMSDLSHVSMEFENAEEGDLSSSVMEIGESQPLTSTRRYVAVGNDRYVKSRDPTGWLPSSDVTHSSHVGILNDELHIMNDQPHSTTRHKDHYEGTTSVVVIGRPLRNEVRMDNWDTYHQGEEAIVKRACAAMKRADRLARESTIELNLHGRKTFTKTGLSRSNHVGNVTDDYGRDSNEDVNHVRGHVRKTFAHVRPIYMSTPLVENSAANKMVASRVRRTPIEPESYKHLLDSAYLSSLRGNDELKESGMDRILYDLDLDAHSFDDQYLISRNGNNFCKRYSWPFWQPRRYKYFLERPSLASSSVAGNRRPSADDRPRLRRSTSDDVKKYSRRYLRRNYR